MFRSFHRRLLKAVKRHGVVGTMRLVPGNVAKMTRRLASAAGLRPADGSDEPDYDRKYNVDTVGRIHLSELAVDDPNWVYGERYIPIETGLFREMLEEAKIDPSHYTFVDIGCGKGRPLLLASEYPFRKIVGVELSPELVAVARRNLLTYRSETQQCRDIEVLEMDATRYPIPDEPTVLFLANPFDEPVMTPVAENVRKSLESSPHNAVVVYFNPRCDEVWRKLPGFELVKHSPSDTQDGYSIYKYRAKTG